MSQFLIGNNYTEYDCAIVAEYIKHKMPKPCEFHSSEETWCCNCRVIAEMESWLKELGYESDRGKQVIRRSSGDLICEQCGKKYYDHPIDDLICSAIDNKPFLHILCNGDRVKL